MRLFLFLVILQLAFALSERRSTGTSDLLFRYLSLWSSGECEKLGALLSPSFQYAGGGLVLSRAQVLAACSSVHFLFQKVNAVDFTPSQGLLSIVGTDLFPSNHPNISMPCVVPYAAQLFGSSAQNGTLLAAFESFNLTQYMAFYAACGSPASLSIRSVISRNASLKPVKTQNLSDPAIFAQNFNMAIWTSNFSGVVGAVAKDFVWKDGYAGSAGNLSTFLDINLYEEPEAILTDNWIVDENLAGDLVVTLSGPSMVVVINGKTKKPCLIPIGQNAVITLTPKAPFKVKSLIFSYDSYNIDSLGAACNFIPSEGHRKKRL